MALQDEQAQSFSIPIFKGYNQSVNEQFLDPGETQNAQNFIVDDGALTVTSGFSVYNTASVTGGIKSLMAYYKNNTDGTITSYLLASNSTTLFKYNTGTNAWDAIKTGLTDGRIDYINYQQGTTPCIIMGNGSDSPWKFDGTTCTTLGGSPPKFKSVALHYERVWGVGNKAYPDTVYFSADFDPENWNTAVDETGAIQGGEIDIKTWDGGKIIGISDIFDDIVVFKTNSIHRISGAYADEFSLEKVFSTTGAIAERSIVNAVNVAFFLAKDGIYSYNGTTAVCISDPVKNVISNMDLSYVENATAVFYQNKYILAFPEKGSSLNNCVIEYDTVKNTFIVKRGLTVMAFLVYSDMLLFSTYEYSGSMGYVYKYNTGSAYHYDWINAFWETPLTDLDLPNAKKVCNEFYATVTGTGTLKVEAIFDGVSKSVNIVLNNSTPKVVKAKLRNKGRLMKFKFSNVNGSSFKIINPKFLIDIDID